MLSDRKFQVSLLFFVTGIFISLFYFHSPVHDFGSYYFGSRFALDGVAIRDIYEPFQFNLLIRDLPSMQREQFLANYAVVPPFNLLFYVPFALAPVFISKLLFNLLSVFFFSFSVYRLLKSRDLNSPWILILPLLLILPFRNNILFGQSYLLLAALLMEGYLASEKKKNILSALFFSLAIALKIFPVIILVFLVFRKQIRLAAWTALFSVILFLAPLYYSGMTFLSEFIFQTLPRIAVNEINNPYAVNYQSFATLLKNLFVPDALLNPGAPFDSPAGYVLLSGIFSGVLLFLLLRYLLNAKDHFSAFGFTLFTGLLITAYGSTYSLMLLFPAAMLIVESKRPGRNMLLLLLFIAVNLPLSLYRDWPVGLRYPRLYLLMIIYAAMELDVRRGLRYPVLLAGSILVFFVISVFLFRMPKEDSHYYLDREVALLIYDFKFENNNWEISFIGENGPEEKSLPAREDITTIERLTLQNNQVYFHRQLTFGDDNKKNPVLVNNKYILYLSDKGRGIGFYTLRKILLPEES